MAFGAPPATMASRIGSRLGGLDDLAGPQAAGAHPQALNAAVDDGTHRLEVGFEPAGPDVVCVADGAAHDGALVADFAALGHECFLIPSRRRLWPSGQTPDYNRLAPRGAKT